MINHELLRSFIAAADSGSFSAAGRLLGKHQATISGNIARLEDELNIILFDRVGKYPELTEHGQALYDSAKVVVDSSERFNANAQQLASGAPASLRIGIDHHLDIIDFVNVFQVLHKQYPLIQVSIISCSSSELLELTKSGSLDLSLCPALEGQSQHYEFCNVGPWPIRFVCGKRHPLAKKSRVSNDDLAAHTQVLALSEDHENLQYLGERMSPYIWECQGYNTSLSIIEANIGWGFLYSAQKPLSAGLVEFFPEFALTQISIAYDIIWPKSQSLSTVSKLLVDSIRECFLSVRQ